MFTRQIWRPTPDLQDRTLEYAPVQDPEAGFYRDPVRWLLVKTQEALHQWPSWDDDTVVVVCVDVFPEDMLHTEWRGARWRHLLYINRESVEDYPEGEIDGTRRFTLRDRCYEFSKR